MDLVDKPPPWVTPAGVLKRAQEAAERTPLPWFEYVQLTFAEERTSFGRVFNDTTARGPTADATTAAGLAWAIEKALPAAQAWLASLSRPVLALADGGFPDDLLVEYRSAILDAMSHSMAWLENYRTALTRLNGNYIEEGILLKWRRDMAELEAQAAKAMGRAAAVEARVEDVLDRLA